MSYVLYVLGIVVLIVLVAAFFVLSFAMPMIFPILLFLLLLYLAYWYIINVHPLPKFVYGVADTSDLPAIPYILWEYAATAFRLNARTAQREQAFAGLTEEHTIDGVTKSAYQFLGLGDDDGVDTARSLDRPDQFSMAWTTFGGGNQFGDAPFGDGSGRTLKEAWSDSLVDPAEATRQFWPTLAKYGVAYNLLVIRKPAPDEEIDDLLALFPEDDLQNRSVTQALHDEGRLFEMDMTIFERFDTLDPLLFTPATRILLHRDPDTGNIEPFAIQVSGFEGAGKTLYRLSYPTDADSPVVSDGTPPAAWIYALQAAKASLTCWGIWIGHVFHFHIVTAAMQMTMLQAMHPLHPVRQILGRQSDHLIGFDQFLLAKWDIGPPTSFTTPSEFLRLMDAYAGEREFFDDDLPNRLESNNLDPSDFTSPPSTDPDQPAPEAWDRYPIVVYYTRVWDACETYVGDLVDLFYGDDEAVLNDGPLQDWISNSGNSGIGNISGLPDMTTKQDLKAVLTSLIYRITVHGYGRLMQSAQPALSFAANFPPCLQRNTIPDSGTLFVFKTGVEDGGAGDPPDADSLADYLPKTGTIGLYVKFLYTFIYSPPYNEFVPLDGIDAEPEHPFQGRNDPGGLNVNSADCVERLADFRRALIDTIDQYADHVAGVDGAPAQIHQWPLNIET